jgi:hypothetical protein
MNLKPSYLRAFGVTFATVFGAVVFLQGGLDMLQHGHIHFENLIGLAALGGVLLGLCVVVFTPREITWDAEKFSIKTLFPGSGDFEWSHLEAWCPYGRGMFLIKFEGKQAYQIPPSGFQPKEWKEFRSYLELRFKDRKTQVWLGVIPIRFGKK